MNSALAALPLLLLLLLPCFGAYLVHHACVAYLARPRNLKRAYQAEWALVTGASSGQPSPVPAAEASSANAFEPACTQASARRWRTGWAARA